MATSASYWVRFHLLPHFEDTMVLCMQHLVTNKGLMNEVKGPRLARPATYSVAAPS